MGAFVPCDLVDRAYGRVLAEKIHLPVIREMARRGTPFRGLLYAGLMLTPDGPRVLEFNARFGDPECQPLMCLWDEDVLPWLHGAATGRLPEGEPRFADGAACCVVLAAPGYPGTPDKGIAVTEPPAIPGVAVFFAGCERVGDGSLRTTGGRVLGVTGVGEDLATARDRAYRGVAAWSFPGAQVRRDIAAEG
jgi:phosphoribosylamine--glycine ligase